MAHHKFGAVWGRSSNAANPHLTFSVDTDTIFGSIGAKSMSSATHWLMVQLLWSPKLESAIFIALAFFVYWVKSYCTLQEGWNVAISCPFKPHLHLFFHKWKQSSGQNCKRDFTASFVLEDIKTKIKYRNNLRKKPTLTFPNKTDRKIYASHWAKPDFGCWQQVRV